MGANGKGKLTFGNKVPKEIGQPTFEILIRKEKPLQRIKGLPGEPRNFPRGQTKFKLGGGQLGGNYLIGCFPKFGNPAGNFNPNLWLGPKGLKFPPKLGKWEIKLTSGKMETLEKEEFCWEERTPKIVGETLEGIWLNLFLWGEIGGSGQLP